MHTIDIYLVINLQNIEDVFWVIIKQLEVKLIEMGELLQSSVVYLAVVTLNKQGIGGVAAR